jgi:SAM-dependent methyltransferase
VDYHRCRSCALLQQHPLPKDVAAFYEHYPIHAKKSALYDALRWMVMGGLYYDAGAHGPGTRIVDYGCGDGGYLETLGGKGYELIGFETDTGQAARLTDHLGVPVHHSHSALFAAVDGNAEVVTMHFVVEHLTDLDDGFETARRLLRPDGVFYFVVPHEHSLEARLFGRKWHNLDPPRHVSFPEAAHVARLAERHGLRLERHAPVPFPNGFAASLPVVLTGRFRFALFALALPLGLLFSRLVPTGTRAYWLRRLP